MSVFEDQKEALEKYEFMMGLKRGRLAVGLDLITDALTLVGMHAVYCHSARFPNKPQLDVEQIIKHLEDSKELLTSVMAELKRERDAERESSTKTTTEERPEKPDENPDKNPDEKLDE